MPKQDEMELISQFCKEIKLERTLGKEVSKKLLQYFDERFSRALNLIENGAVKRYIFKPSGRIIWEVKGKRASYQVMPNTNFCSCDDYYFRVMNAKKQLCYHIIAQRIALVLDKFEKEECHDRFYSKITRKWKRIT